jgi:hypothetical protein
LPGIGACVIPFIVDAMLNYVLSAVIFVFIVTVLIVLWKREHSKKD